MATSQRRRRVAALASVAALAVHGAAQPTSRSVAAQSLPRPVLFVHGLGASAAQTGTAPAPGAPAPFGDLLTALQRAYPRPGVCQAAAQPGRGWDGSPCVFRYVEDLAESDEGGAAARGPNDSQSSVASNADKLAREVAEVVANAGGQRVVLIGYSMGGAIIRTYLALHREEAARDVRAVVLIDAVASGSWGFTVVDEATGRISGPLGRRLLDALHSIAATSAAVDFDRPAVSDLRPRSALFRRVAAVEPPPSISYYTFWGDIRVRVSRALYVYELPAFEMPSLGDLGLLPGDPDPSVLPELGGQRFSPRVDAGAESLDVPHTTTIDLSSGVVRDLLERCGRPSQQGSAPCLELVAGRFDVPSLHTAVPVATGRITVDVPAFGGRMSLTDAVVATVRRSEGSP